MSTALSACGRATQYQLIYPVHIHSVATTIQISLIGSSSNCVSVMISPSMTLCTYASPTRRNGWGVRPPLMTKGAAQL